MPDVELGSYPREIPGWSIKPVGTLGEVVAGKAKNKNGSGELKPYLRVANVFDGRIDIKDVFSMSFSEAEFDRYRLQYGDVLLNEGQSLDLVGRCSIYKDEYPAPCAIQNALIRFRAGDDCVADFAQQLFRWCQSTGIFASIATQTTSIAHLGVSRFAALKVMVPPLAEQRKIAAILTSVDEAIEKTQAVIDQVQVVKKGLTQELLTRGLPGRHKKYKQTEIGEIPASWEVVEIGRVFDVQLGKMVSPASQTGHHTRPYLRNINVYWDRLNLEDVSEMDFNEREREKFRLQAGDLLACEGRFVGRCAIWDGSVPEMYYQKALHRIRAIDTRTTTAFMKHFMMLRFRYDDRFVTENRHASTIPHLPREKLIAMQMAIPSREEQDEIVAALESVASTEQTNTAMLNALNGTKQALMSVLLTGELRVTP